MTYQSKHTDILSAKDGYNKISEEYRKYHTLLDNFDQGMYKRYLPRSAKNIAILDLGAGDGRIFSHLKHIDYSRFVACDIADKLLKKHPGPKKVEKVICNLEEDLPFEAESFDLITSFFVLEHINDLHHLFEQAHKVLKTGGRRIIGHFLQRHEFTWRKDNQIFKIQFYNHRVQDLEKIAKENFFSLDIFPVEEKSSAIGHIMVLEKN